MVYRSNQPTGDMHLGLVIPRTGDHDPTELAIDAETRGYDSVWMGELWGTSSVVKLSEIAAQTDTIGLGACNLERLLTDACPTCDDRGITRSNLGWSTLVWRRDQHPDSHRERPWNVVRAARPPLP